MIDLVTLPETLS